MDSRNIKEGELLHVVNEEECANVSSKQCQEFQLSQVLVGFCMVFSLTLITQV